MKITNVTVTVVEIPQVAPIAPYRSHVRSSSTTCSAIVQVDTEDGITGWGEHNVNFIEFSAREMQKNASEWLVGRDAMNLAAFHQQCPLETRLKSGIELALWDIRGKALGKPVAELLGGILRPEVELAACMGIQTYERAGEIASMYVEQGYTSLKTKAGADMQEDLDMVRGVRDAVGDRLKLRIDPNRAYSPEEAADLGRRLEEYELEYFEQPIPAEPLETANWLRQQTKTPIALNESVVDPASAIAIIKADAAEYLLPDTHIAGGIWPCVQIGTLCEASGIPCIMHCGHDLGPKTAAMVHIAASCPSYTLANDSTYFGLEDDILTEMLEIKNGRIAVPELPGLGIEGDREKLAKYAVDC